MRVQIVITRLHGGGAERVAGNLANAWNRRGDAVEIVLLGQRSDRDYLVDSGVTFRELGLAGASNGLAAALVQNARRVLAIRRAARSFRPDVVIGVMTEASTLVGLSGLGAKVITVGSEHSDPSRTAGNRFWRFARRLGYPLLDAVVALTERDMEWMAKRLGLRRLRVIPNAVEWPLLNSPPVIPPDAIVSPNSKLLLGVGRLEPVKGFRTLIEVFAAAFGDRPDWSLAIVGAGSEDTQLRQHAVQLGIADRVHFPGRVGNIADWHRRATVFGLTSEIEGIPMVLMEAMAHGTPGVCFACSQGVSDMVEHEANGVLVPPGGKADFARALVRLADDPALLERFSREAQEVRRRYSVQRILADWDSLFGTVAAERSKGPLAPVPASMKSGSL